MARVLLGVPCPDGPCWTPATAIAIMQASKIHEVTLQAAVGSWDNFNLLWANALNAGQRGEQDYYVKLHSDLEPTGAVDTLVELIQQLQADIVTTIVPQKSTAGLTSSGVGDLSDPWLPHRRYTMHEIWGEGAPETFNEDVLGKAAEGKYLLHNDGCFVADLKSPCWWKTEKKNGRDFLIASFEWTRGVEVVNGEAVARGESEDWYFSRALHRIGARAYMTRKVALNHVGVFRFTNQAAWGSVEHDEQTRGKWGAIEDESGSIIGAGKC